MYSAQRKNISGISFLTFPFLKKYAIFCGFTCRDTGYSRNHYNSLNLAYHVLDERETVRQNRQLVLEKILGMDKGCLYSAVQVHGNNVIYVNGDAEHDYGDIGMHADGLMTDREDVPVMVMGADCSLLLFADIRNRAVCAVHAGWKGTLGHMAFQSLGLFCRRFGSRVRDIYVFIGPGIRKCCYKVSGRMAGDFRRVFGDGDYLSNREKGKYLDLPELNLRQVKDFGVPDENIFDTGECTYCGERYYSYRKEKVTGRQAAIAMIYRVHT